MLALGRGLAVAYLAVACWASHTHNWTVFAADQGFVFGLMLGWAMKHKYHTGRWWGN